MSEVQRLTTATDEDWWANPPTPGPAPDPMTEAARADRLETFTQAWIALNRAIDDLDENLAVASDDLESTLNYSALAETVAHFQEWKRRLGVMESYLARQLGTLEGCPDTITLPDGSRAEVLKGKDRKAWEHPRWKRDVVNAVVEQAEAGHGELVAYVADERTGEARTVEVGDLIAQALDVPGSTAPKTTALKALGLRADDYCETYPGPWAVKITRPTKTA
jgi:hypothetical protein